MKQPTCSNSSLPTCESEESGFVLILFAVIMLVIVGIVAMVVDHSRLSLSLDTLQRAADAAALSGAKRFNGKIEGWQSAKKAAVLALKQNPVLGVNPDSRSDIILTDGPSAYNETNTVHPGSSGTSGKLSVTVERGVLWHDYRLKSPASERYPDGRQGGYRFISLEGSTANDLPVPKAVDGYLYSNAVKVTLKIDSLATTFGRVFGALGFNNLEQTSIAVTHEDLEVSIAPIAIPLCALRLNDDPYAADDELELDYVKYSASCARQGVAAEADPKRELPAFNGDRLEQLVADEISRRREGITRFESYLRPLYAYYDPAKGVSVCYSGNNPGYKHNCKTVPLWGILGIPSSTPGEQATADQIAAAFAEGVTASPGMFWSGLQSLRGFKTKPNLADVIAEAIQNPPRLDQHTYQTTFYDEFTEAYQGQENIRVAKRNFPFIRNARPACGGPGPADDTFDPERRPCLEDDPTTVAINEADSLHDLRKSWPTTFEVDGEPVKARLLMDRRYENVSRQPLDYTNPLATHPRIPKDSVNSGGDPKRHKVTRTLAAVIAPGVEKKNGKAVVYCDAEGLFSGYVDRDELLSVAPVRSSRPVILGFIPIATYDVGLKDLDAVEEFKPRGVTNPLSYAVVRPGFRRSTTYTQSPIIPPNGWSRVNTPFYTDPASGETIVDRNPGELDVLGNLHTNRARGYVEEYDEEHAEWRQCVDSEKRKCEEKRTKAKGGQFLGIPEEYIQCFDFREVFANRKFGNVVLALDSMDTSQCATANPLEPSVTCISDQDEEDAGKMFNILQQFFEKNIAALPYSHCLPRKDIEQNLNIHDKSNPDYYVQPIDTNRAGFGAGGVLFKTRCGTGDGIEQNTIFMPGGVNWDATTPAIVAEDIDN